MGNFMPGFRVYVLPLQADCHALTPASVSFRSPVSTLRPVNHLANSRSRPLLQNAGRNECLAFVRARHSTATGLHICFIKINTVKFLEVYVFLLLFQSNVSLY